MPRNSQGGFAQILVILILLIGVGVGIYLVQHPQIFNPRASVSGPVSGPIDDSTTPPTGTLKMTLSNASSGGNSVAWATRGAQSAPFQLNKTYKISFWYKAGVTSELRMRDNGLVTLNPANNLTYYSTTKTLTQNFNGQPCNNYGGDNQCYLLFHLYGNGNFEIGNLKIEEVDSGSPNMIANATTNNSSWYGWSVCIPSWKGSCSVSLTGTPSSNQASGNHALRMFLTNASSGGNHVAWANRGGQSIPFQLNRTYTFSFSYRSSVVFDLMMRDNGIQTYNPTNGPDESKTVTFSRTFTNSFDGAPCNNYGGDNQCYLLFHLYGNGFLEIKDLKVVDNNAGNNTNLMSDFTYDGSSWADWSVCIPDWRGTCQVFNPVVSYGLNNSPTPTSTPIPTATSTPIPTPSPTPTPSNMSYVTGKFSSAVELKGVGGLVAPNNRANDNSYCLTRTVEFWVKPKEIGRWQYLIGKPTTTNSVTSAYDIYLKQDGKIGYGHYVGTASGTSVSSQTVLQPNNWYHVAAVYNYDQSNSSNSGAYIFINGVKEGFQQYHSVPGQCAFGQPFKIGGAYYTSDILNGVIDDVRVSNIARYINNFTVPATPYSTDQNTIGLWNFDQTLSDQSSLRNNLTIFLGR